MEPEPEPEPEVADEKLQEETVSTVPTATTSRAETAKSIQERAREQSDMVKRLSLALRPKEMGMNHSSACFVFSRDDNSYSWSNITMINPWFHFQSTESRESCRADHYRLCLVLWKKD